MDTAKEKTSSAAQPAPAAGLEGVVAASSRIGDVDGINGILIYQGYNIHDLAEHSTFEETVYLLWHSRLPTKAELEDLKQQLGSNQTPSAEVLEMMRHLPKDADPMDVLRTAVSSLSLYDRECCDTSREGALRTATRLTGQLPVLVAAWDRIRNGKEPVAPKPELNIATNFLYMLRGQMPEEREARILDIALILHADHELNASTFTSRVVAATLADMYGAVTAAIAALAGPLHGGANTEVMRMLKEIGEESKAEEWIRGALSQKKKIMGFGHRVYKTEDPRATWLRRFSEELGRAKGDMRWFELSRKVEQTIMAEKKLYPNVDFYSASTYYMMDIPLDLFTPIFAVSRVSGWTGHILEQYGNNRLIRPRAEYTGPRDLTYTPIAAR
jgi:citrate synthase